MAALTASGQCIESWVYEAKLNFKNSWTCKIVFNCKQFPGNFKISYLLSSNNDGAVLAIG